MQDSNGAGKVKEFMADTHVKNISLKVGGAPWKSWSP